MNQILKNHIQKTIDLSEIEMEKAYSFFSEEHFKKREMIINENDQVNHVYFIVSGLLKLFYTDNEAKEHIISFSMEDWWESDYAAFYTQTKATQSLQCLEDTIVLKLSLEGYYHLLNDVPKMTDFFLKKAVGGHISSQRRILSLMTMNAKERYEQFIKFYPSLIQRIPKTVLALYLGVSRETLSRLESK
ncbi:Crp/Fnr family transcriptional regulator [Chryseobacterium chendengshani]|uniref:Crp/Fnr family transcriptional regulator n=1 Tax=Chryseobacterium sp. LJ668 TaxID=2864040 RepID=UPI001C68AC2C|nr:Crp/Fnr family transcriptional regulator [Chryseobacterium sp. LJ668]MBW8523243.1 Crp/Fnr family transcriptional regulator [Chryseobacterium sp. LJ668]QYK15536.1 Crp/Fnr family transcriptional regulator [Chryseobacterium sp. LJ668]